MWFLFAILTALAWGTADLFYKKGNRPEENYSHLKTVIMVGLIMGIHAIVYMFINDLSFDWGELIKYLPVSAMYILSMAIGYFGLRYIELSISSPVQNSSGVITAILLFIFFEHTLSALEIIGIAMVSFGVIMLAVFERKEELKLQNQIGSIDKKYQIGVLAIIFPILYALIDGIGTFLDGIYLDEMKLISEDNALIAYEFTFLIVGILCWIYLTAFKKEKVNIFKEHTRGAAAIFETAGQFFYVFAMSTNAIIVAPIVATYSIFSVILSRIFLKEKLTPAQYTVVALVLLGIAVLGIADEL